MKVRLALHIAADLLEARSDPIFAQIARRGEVFQALRDSNRIGVGFVDRHQKYWHIQNLSPELLVVSVEVLAQKFVSVID